MTVAGHYPEPFDTGAQRPKGGVELDINTSRHPLLPIVYVLDSLAVGFSVLTIHLNCLEGCKTQISGSHTWDSDSVGRECD